MSIAPNSRVFLLAVLVLPIFSAHANVNRGDSPLREIQLGKLTDFHASVSPADDSFADGSAVNCPALEHFEFDTREAGLDESNAEKEELGDEAYFGSATWSEVSKPKMVDFSFGQPCGPLSWWKSFDVEIPTVALTSQAVALPKMNFEWGNLREPAIPSRGGASTNAGMAFLPLSLLGVLGLVLRRG